MIDIAALRAAEFPVTERYTYLNHASLGPLPRRTATALAELLRDFSEQGMLAETRWFAAVERTRALLARLLNVGADSLALTRNTSEGLALIAAAMPWQPGDVIITAEGEFPANVYPWLSLAQQGVETRLVPLREGRIVADDIATAIDRAEGRARLVSLSWVQYHNGFRCDVAAISSLCRKRGVLFGLDAIQGAGVLPLDLAATPVDFCSFGCQKWLLSPHGAGALYLGERLRSLLRPLHTGWLGVAWADYSAFDYASPLVNAAARFEEGTRSLLCITGLEQSLGLLLELGVDNVAQRILALTERLIEALLARGLALRTPAGANERSGIVSFAVVGPDRSASPQATSALFAALEQAGVVASLREGGIRISPHVYTSDEEIDLVLDIIDRQLKARAQV